jgi:hypothetical protein
VAVRTEAGVGAEGRVGAEGEPSGRPSPPRPSLVRRFRDERLVALDQGAEHDLAGHLSWWSAVVIGVSAAF